MWRSVVQLVLIFATLGYCSEIIKFEEDDYDDTLVLTTVVFRHGDRTPDVSSIYPNDPYINETYFPVGKGQLTMDGKMRAYALGESLRWRYRNFLGDVYYPDLLESTTSAYPRTMMTLQSVHAALFPPSGDFRLRHDLKWQPIAYKYSEFQYDKLIATFQSCDRVFDIVDDLERTPEYKKRLNPYRKLNQYLSEHSGWNVNNTRLLFFIQNTLKCQEEWGFKLPDWSKKIWPDILGYAATNFWKVISSTVELRRILVGNLLKKIIDDSTKKAEGTLLPEDRKMFLYSGHDFTVVPILAAIGQYDGEHLPYTAHVIIELHRINGLYGFKIFLQDFKETEPRLLQVKGCETFCPLAQFTELMRDHFPGDNWCPS